MFTSKPCHFLLKTKGEGVPENFPKTLSRDGAPGETRTHTGRVLNPLPLPIGLLGRRAKVYRSSPRCVKSQVD